MPFYRSIWRLASRLGRAETALRGHASVGQPQRHLREFVAEGGEHGRKQPERGGFRGRDTYLRTLLVQGARAVMRFVHRHDDRHSRWIKAVMQRRHVSVAAIALANKTARIAWAILASNDSFKMA